MKTWRLIEDAKCDGGYNMATDWAILQACNEGKSPPTIRLYGWATPTLSVGYSQKGNGQINRERCAQRNIPIVKRPTGGRAVLHDRELTYSLIAPLNHPRFAGGLQKTFHAVSDILLECLTKLGVPAERHTVAKERQNPTGQIKTPACFASSNRFEISAHDKKLVGSAQRRLNHAFLQHGSVLIDLDRALLNALLVFPDESSRMCNLELLNRRAGALNETCNKIFSFEDVRETFRDGFLKAFFGEIGIGKTTDFEADLRVILLRGGDCNTFIS